MDTNKMREQFESWADSEGYVMDRIWGGDGNHGYEDEDTKYAWGLFQHAWQASREAVVVELPDTVANTGTLTSGAVLGYKRECREAIEAQGLKVEVKP